MISFIPSEYVNKKIYGGAGRRAEEGEGWRKEKKKGGKHLRYSTVEEEPIMESPNQLGD